MEKLNGHVVFIPGLSPIVVRAQDTGASHELTWELLSARILNGLKILHLEGISGDNFHR